MLRFRKCPVAKKFMDKRGGGIIKIFRRIFLSHSTERFRRVTLLCCFRKFLVAKKFMDKRGDIQDFRSKISCLTVPKTSVGQPYRVSLISGTENFYASEGCVTIFCQNFLSHSAEKTS